MANTNLTVFECDNKEVLKAFELACENDDKRCHKAEEIKGNKACVTTKWGTAHYIAAEISKQYPDKAITCFYSYEYDNFCEVEKVEYLAGEAVTVDLIPEYMFPVINVLDEADLQAIYDKVRALCRRLDVVEKDENDTLQINWFNCDVVFKFEHDGANNKKYQIEVEKKHHTLEFKIFEGIVKYDWRAMDLYKEQNDDVLF